MGWSNDKEPTKKKMETSSKVLLAIIACLVLIISLIIMLLLNIQTNTFNITVDGKGITVSKEALISKIDDKTYINIEEFSKLVKYEYHNGEYKAFSVEDNKCYVQGTYETATFFLNDNTVYKLPINDITSEYREFTVQDTVKEINKKMYASIEMIKLAFNVQITESKNSLTIFTLDYLVNWFDTKTKEWGYTGISDLNFENQKAILYNYLIVKKQGGLYKIISTDNKKEIASDKYISIQFDENTKEFFVTNSLKQVGIMNLDGTTKIEPVYESISVLDKNLNLYIIQKDKKFGVVKSGNITIIYPEYDSIGLDIKDTASNIESKYIILDTLIPVYKNEKWGAFDKEGNKIYDLSYDGFGCNITTVEVNGTKKAVEPVVYIEQCEGVVVRQGEKYKLLDVTGKELISTAVDSIYAAGSTENEKHKYYMLYNNKELNIIEELIKAGLLEDEVTDTNLAENTVIENSSNLNNATNNVLTNTL